LHNMSLLLKHVDYKWKLSATQGAVDCFDNGDSVEFYGCSNFILSALSTA